MRLRLLTAVLFATLIPQQLSFAQTPASGDVDALVCAWFDAPDDASRAAAVKAIQSRKDVTIQQVEDAVRRGVFYKPQPSGTVTRKITVEFNKQETDCTFWVPPGYDPRKSYPALVIMHGTGGTGDKFLARWLPYVEKRDMIVIAPASWSVEPPTRSTITARPALSSVVVPSLSPRSSSVPAHSCVSYNDLTMAAEIAPMPPTAKPTAAFEALVSVFFRASVMLVAPLTFF